ncbi:lambda exonuclease family protein [Gordonia sp. DT219]|uniref:lambda exonuclease family protein n=1 Tax=Gordonia sp. DT219 TaxID=3416658 RepID=UPI003CEC22ED
MSLHILPEMEQRSPEWYEHRRGIVTASAVGGLIAIRKPSAIDHDCPNCGAAAQNPCVSKRTPEPIKTLHTERAAAAKSASSPTVIEPARNETSRSITDRLVAERITGWCEEGFLTDAMWRGINDEPLARAVYAEHYHPVKEVGFMVRDDWGFKIGYSPDGLVGDHGLIEIKSRAPKNQLATVLSGHPPIENMAQLQCGLLVSGRRWIDYISYAGGMHMWRKRIWPDERWFDAIVSAVRNFEAAAAEMQRLYAESVEGLPMTERTIIEQEISI